MAWPVGGKTKANGDHFTSGILINVYFTVHVNVYYTIIILYDFIY